MVIACCEAVDVNRTGLCELLDREGVDPDAYSVDGARRNECLILEVEPGGWCVYYSERGLRSGEQHFDTEDEACEEMAQMLLRDQSNRYVLVVGPLEPDAADEAFGAWLSGHGFNRESLRRDDWRVDNPVLRAGEQSRRYWMRRTVLR